LNSGYLKVMTQRGIPFATCFDREGKKAYSRRKDVVHLLTYPRRKKGGLRHFENRWEMRYQMEIEQISEKP
ncbi:hypothetical protein OHE83_14455, partial [Escherichia coli]|nr:hypothetical protein [Escherichia coli]